MNQVLIYGDSLSWGIIPNTRQRFEFDKRWPGVMQREFDKLGESVRIIEDCLNGRRTAWEDPYKPGRNGLVGLEQRVEINSPLSLVIVALGTNDFQSMHQLSAWQSAQGIAAIVSTIRRAPLEPGMEAPAILIVAPPLIQTAKGSIAPKFDGASEKAAGLTTAIQKVARDTNCHFFNAGSVIERSAIDGIHLDEDQHHRLGIVLATELRPILQNCHRRPSSAHDSLRLDAMAEDDLAPGNRSQI